MRIAGRTGFIACVAIIPFYGELLFSPHASIHWDLADVSYPAQKYFSDSVFDGKLPEWTPYLSSGIPFLSDPRTGAWYPLHWPFFLIGITPRSLAWELALHAFLAWTGAYLLARRMFGEAGPAAVGALLYAGGGFFAAHSSLLGKFEAAAVLPWLLWAALGALETGAILWTGVAGLIGGLIVLTGDIPAALECFLALIFFVAAAKPPWSRGVSVVCASSAVAVLLGAIVLLPALELSAQAVRADLSAAALPPGTFATLVAADHYGLMTGLYSGPEDIRQHYLYSGLLLLPLAIAGFARRQKMLPPLALLVPAIWFAFGRRAGLYAALSLLPGLRGSAPADIWFVAALGLSLAAASGAIWIVERIQRPHVWIALLALAGVDLWFWNLHRNPLVFAHVSFDELYGKHLDSEAARSPFARIWAPAAPLTLGPAGGPLIRRMEATYGSGLADLDRYAEYMRAAENNSKLLNGLGVTHLLEEHGGKLIENPENLGRVSAPPTVSFVADRKAAAQALATLDPARAAVVEAPARPLGQSVPEIRIVNYQDDFYRIRYTAASDSLLRIALPYFPGWRAALDGQSLEVLPVDQALTGVIVPAGTHELTLQFRSRRLRPGVILNLIGVGLGLGLIWGSAFIPRVR